MKTIFIYDQCGQSDIKFFVMEGDYSNLNNVYLNCGDSDESLDLEDELSELLYNNETGENNVEFLDTFPVNEVESDTVVVTVGFFP